MTLIAQKPIKTVLFVCIGNSGRSQMAEAFFNHLAKGKARAYSAGTQPAHKVSPVAIDAMLEVGIDISNNIPKALTPELMEQVDRIVTMGCGVEAGAVCPATFTETKDWGLEDPKGKTLEQVRKIRDEIRVRVLRLLGEASKN